MAQSNLLQSLQAGTTPPKLRMMIAQGLAPLAPNELMELLVFLLKDSNSEIAANALKTITSWDEEEILALLKSKDCAPSVLEFFASAHSPDRTLQAIITNPASPNKIIELLALTVPVPLLETILDNRSRIIESPQILKNVKQNPAATTEIQRVVQEIETEFLGAKKKEYAVEEAEETAASPLESLELEFEAPPEDLSLEGLPLDSEAREAAITKRLASMSVRDKIKYALFGNREIRAVLVRDTNKEVSRAVLKSPKITENEIESISTMRSVGEEILREIGNSKEWTKGYAVTQNLVKNPKTPPAISQRMMFRLRTQDLSLLTKDRSLPDAVRQNATRLLKQRSATRHS